MLEVSPRSAKATVICQPLRAAANHSDLSTAAKQRGDGVASENHSDLSTIARFREIDRRRSELKISTTDFIAAAKLYPATYFNIKNGKVTPRPATLRRMQAALLALHPHAASARPPALIAAFVRAAELIITAEIGGNAKLIAAVAFARHRSDGRPPSEVEPERIRRLAIYLAAVELQVENADIARALCCARQNIKQARDKVEKLRDHKLVDALLDRCAAKVRPA